MTAASGKSLIRRELEIMVKMILEALSYLTSLVG
jgi:hypothetical protein